MRVRSLVVAAALSASAALAACGEEDFENNPRPPAPIELSALVNDQKVLVSPDNVGAGLATITVSNQSEDPATFTLSGPDDITSQQILPGDTGQIKVSSARAITTVSAGDDSTARDGRLDRRPRARELAKRPAAPLVLGLAVPARFEGSGTSGDESAAVPRNRLLVGLGDAGLGRLGDQGVDPLQLLLHRLDHRVEALTRALSELVLIPVSADRIACACLSTVTASAAASRTAARRP